jgi:ABC-type phosphate/phosphonate transport system substrate-binding protein
MNTFPSKSLSDNQKSAIQNLKWLGLSVFAFVLVVAGAVASAQQTKKNFRIGYLSSQNAEHESARAEGIRLAPAPARLR